MIGAVAQNDWCNSSKWLVQ